MTRDAERELLAAGARHFNLALDSAEVEALLRLADELQTANAQFNLTAIRDRPGILRKHLLDSLSLQPFLRGLRIADVGTGAGFPGLPLAIANPQRRFSLIEATGKKARFVAQTARSLACVNVEVVHARAENYRPAKPFDTVVARALSSLADFVVHAGHLCAPDGRMLAMKGKRPVEELAALPRGFRVSGVHPVARAGAGRRAPYCGTLAGQARIAEPKPYRRRGPHRAKHETGHCCRKPKRRSGQDHHGGQSRGLVDGHQEAGLADRSGSARQCHHGVRHREESLSPRTSCDVLLGDCTAMEALVPVEYGGFMLMPANQDLTAAEVRMLSMMAGREFKLRNALKPIREDFDVILIDCPPSLNMLTLNALVAADSVIVPMQCEYYALEGLSALVQTIEQIRGQHQPGAANRRVAAHHVRSAQ